MNHAPDFILCRVEVWNWIDFGLDKLAATNRKIIRIYNRKETTGNIFLWLKEICFDLSDNNNFHSFIQSLKLNNKNIFNFKTQNIVEKHLINCLQKFLICQDNFTDLNFDNFRISLSELICQSGLKNDQIKYLKNHLSTKF